MWIQTGVAVRKRQIWVQIDDFSSRATLKFGRLFYVTSSFVHRFKAIGEFELEL